MALQQGRYEYAAALLTEGLATVRELGDVFLTSWALYALGYLAVEEGRPEEATCLLKEGLTLARDRHILHVVNISFTVLARVAVAQNWPERALRLLGAAEKLSATTGCMLEPLQRGVYDRALAEAHPQVDEPTYEAAWAVGQAMPLEEAIAYALEEKSTA